MKLKIIEDPENYLDALFTNHPCFGWSRIETNIILFLKYGKNVNWEYKKFAKEFCIKRNGKLLEKLTVDEWKQFLQDYLITISPDKKYIKVTTDKDVEYQFELLLQDLGIVFTKEDEKLDNILKYGTSDPERMKKEVEKIFNEVYN
jgi:hypothetical protein